MPTTSCGAVALELGGRTYTVYPVMTMLSALEDKHGGVLSIARKIEDNALALTELASIIETMLADDAPPRAQIEDAVLKRGAAYYLACVVELVTLVVGGLDRLGESMAGLENDDAVPISKDKASHTEDVPSGETVARNAQS